MRHKKRLYKHLLLIYIFYFAALIVGFTASFAPGFARGWKDADIMLNEDMTRGGVRSYRVWAYVAPDTGGETIAIKGLGDSITTTAAQLDMQVKVHEPYTIGNSFKVLANNSYAWILMVVSGLSFIAILVLIALIINSLRRSIKNETPLQHRNIVLTRIIGILMIASEMCQSLANYINNCEAARLLAGTSFEVVKTFDIDYWDLIVGILFLFMAEVIAMGAELSEEQKLTI